MEKEQIDVIIRRYGDMLYRLALVRLGNREDAQDIVQQTFLKLVEYYDTLESDEHIKAWLIRVCHNLCNNLLRTPWKRRKSDIEEFTDFLWQTTSAEEDAIHNLQIQCLWQELYQLPEKYRTVLHLNYMENYTPAEISKLLNMSYNAVCVRLNRAKKQLAERLDKEDFT